MLNDEFKNQAMQTIAGLRMPRTSWDKIENILIPDFTQNNSTALQEIESLEKKIISTKKYISEVPAQKQAVLKKWLEE